jgi:hypothetical protein
MASTWSHQHEIDTLVAAGYAEVNPETTDRNKRYWEEQGGKPEQDYLLRPMYRWTDAGKEACYPWRYSTPMAWAEQMHKGKSRHCIHCGRSTRQQKVGARFDGGSKQKRNRTVCLSCRARRQRADLKMPGADTPGLRGE